MKTGTEQQAINSLFVPGGTIDIIIHKTTKNTVKLFCMGENFTINKYGVLCAESILPDGKTWYSFCPSRFPKKDIMQSVKTWLSCHDNNFQFDYKL